MLAFRILVTFAALAACDKSSSHELKGTKLELVHTLDAVTH